MKNERMITRKLFISCILILSIIFTTIIILQKEHYEKIIYNYQDSYYFPQARKNFRILRGDSIN